MESEAPGAGAGAIHPREIRAKDGTHFTRLHAFRRLISSGDGKPNGHRGFRVPAFVSRPFADFPLNSTRPILERYWLWPVDGFTISRTPNIELTRGVPAELTTPDLPLGTGRNVKRPQHALRSAPTGPGPYPVNRGGSGEQDPSARRGYSAPAAATGASAGCTDPQRQRGTVHHGADIPLTVIA